GEEGGREGKEKVVLEKLKGGGVPTPPAAERQISPTARRNVPAGTARRRERTTDVRERHISCPAAYITSPNNYSQGSIRSRSAGAYENHPLGENADAPT